MIMKISDALSDFYSKNNLSTMDYSSDSAYVDFRLENLENKINVWLENIDPKYHNEFLDVFSRFTYLTQAVCQKRYEEMTDLLIEDLKKYDIRFDEVLFIVVESDKGTKSGAENIVADLYKRNIKKNIKKEQIVTSVSKYDFRQEYKAIMFLDDIIGSGFTLSNTIKKVVEKINWECRIYFSCLVYSKRGFDLIKRDARGIGIDLNWILKSEWEEKRAFKTNSFQYKVFEQYERAIERITKMDDEEKSFFMGFQKMKLIVSFYYNTPNNTLSTFWCETPQNKPIFPRDGNQPQKSLSLDDLKSKKKATDNSAYFISKMRSDIYSKE